jgi:hypothetical protein
MLAVSERLWSPEHATTKAQAAKQRALLFAARLRDLGFGIDMAYLHAV